MPAIDVARVARLARLELSPAEESRFADQIAAVLDYMAVLQDVDVSGIEPTAHAVPRFDVLRDDIARPGLSADEALGNAPRRVGDQFHVAKVIE